MKAYKHYSFDLWLTLIKSNPEFKMQRAIYFYKNYNTLKKPIEEVVAVFKTIDDLCNAINEKTGKNIDAEEMYLMVISYLNNHIFNFESVNLRQLYSEIEKIIFNYLPIVYSADTIDTLKKIKQKSNPTFNILSNTAFIKGSTLRVILDTMELSPFFEFQIYSDEEGFSKPNPQLFKIMIAKAFEINNEKITLKDFIHTGDNIKADITAAKETGINAFQINSNKNTITDLLY